MTDMVNGITQSQDTDQPVTSSEPQASSSQASTPSYSSNDEKLFKQSEVNDIVGRAKHEAVERFKRADQHAAHQQQNAGMSQDEIRRITAEETTRLRDEWVREAQKQAQQQEAEKVAGEFFSKLNSGKEKYQDFDSVVGDLEFRQIPHIVQLATMVDNTSDVMYELAKQPAKIANIQALVAISPQLAYKEMKRLSDSIKENQAVSNVKIPNEPLSQLRPSIASADNGAMAVRDYRKKYKV
jgi:hypothetical protein